MNTNTDKQNPPPHGGDIYETLLSGKPAPLDFSANISPLGLPEGIRQALAERADEFDRYPDPNCRELTSALSKKHGMIGKKIVCGAGSADLIFRAALALSPKFALVAAPSFSEYGKAAAEAGATVYNYPLLHPSFAVTERISIFVRKVDVVFLCNPNNPTGILTSRDTISQILRICESSNTTLVIDECFMDLVDNPKTYTAEPLLATHKNLIILKAFTKTWAMAGLRLGYALCGSEETARKIRESGPPWSVSVPAQIAGIQALKEDDYYVKLKKLIKDERKKLKDGLVYVGAEVLGSSANFIFFRMAGKAAGRDLAGELAERGILIRDCSNFNGLEDGTYYRVAVLRPDDNARLLFELRTMLL